MLEEPATRDMDLDSVERILVHSKILGNKPMVRGIYKEYFEIFRHYDNILLSGSGSRVELGSGVGQSKSYDSSMITSDLIASDHVDEVIDALNMPFESDSTRAFFGVNFFHHLSDPVLFFGELQRVLSPGGGCVLVEPYYGPLASFIYKRLFDHEYFDKSQVGWASESIESPLKGANQALSFIVFTRDADTFTKLFPMLEITEQRRIHNTLRRLLSGGVNFRQLVPNKFERYLKKIEKVLAPLSHYWAIDHVIVIRKKANAQ